MSVRETCIDPVGTYGRITVEAGFIIKLPARHYSLRNAKKAGKDRPFLELSTDYLYLQDSTCFSAAEIPCNE
jgi:hypothetical protein